MIVLTTIKNKRAGVCTTCGNQVEVGGGEAVKTEQGWRLECGCRSAGTDVADGASSAPTLTSGLQADGSYVLLSGHAASPNQAAVFDHFRFGRGSRIIKAVAGSGKTTTMKNAVAYLPPRLSVQLLAFNVDAADQLKAAIDELVEKKRIPANNNVRASTFHSVGMYAVRRHLNLPETQLRVDDGKCRKLLRQNLPEGEAGDRLMSLYGAFVSQLVGLAKGEGIGALVPDLEEAWYHLVDHHGMYLDSEEATVEMAVEMARRLLRWSNEAAKTGWIDYDDMLYLVCLWKLRLWRNHVVIPDECQDTNPVRRAILHLALLPGGRLYAVGDPKQSIYGFTGASTDAMDLIAKEFNTSELPLTVSYRCARRIVERAQTWVPYIEPAGTAPEGDVVDDLPLVEALTRLTSEDAILCRQTAPLVEVAYGLISRGRACRILGREIGEGLVNLIEQQRARGINKLVEKLAVWRDREMSKFIQRGEENRAEGVADRVNCVLVIVEKLPETERTVPALIAKIRSMFQDDSKGRRPVLTLATVHKAKGQEWERVAILRPELMPSKAARQEWQMEQEENLQYIAATRAKTLLMYVADGDTQVERKG
jgi:DNA helicase II / ATP-dependent DNA helicase PcrA